MKQTYNSLNRIKFTDISEKYAVSNIVKGRLSSAHAMLITYVVKHFKNTRKFKQSVVDALNLLTYAVYTDDPLLLEWSTKQPFKTMPENISSDLIQETLGPLFLDIESIDWDVDPVFSEDVILEDSVQDPINSSAPSSVSFAPASPESSILFPSSTFKEDVKVSKTEKQDLYIQPPEVLQFDFKSRWMSGVVDGEEFTIYSTLPEIPTKQNEISCTTDVTKMTDSELMRLYPDTHIKTRAPVMYQPCKDLELHPTLGLILPIKNYTRAQLIDNLVKYPHLFKLLRKVNGEIYSFYVHLEVDGELKGVLDIWEQLPDTKRIPKQSEFVKEYVVRRYLLERDIDNVHHKYPLYGSLDPFLTLFMEPHQYAEFGYRDFVALSKKCVVSRINYKVSRNPIVRRLENE